MYFVGCANRMCEKLNWQIHRKITKSCTQEYSILRRAGSLANSGHALRTQIWKTSLVT